MQKIEDATAYAPVIGTDRGIVGAENAADHPVPVFSLDMVQGGGTDREISF